MDRQYLALKTDLTPIVFFHLQWTTNWPLLLEKQKYIIRQKKGDKRNNDYKTLHRKLNIEETI
jgi:hypothetical protein